MTSRERVLAAIEHKSPDRVPVDLGGTIMTGISAQALSPYWNYLKESGNVSNQESLTKAYELFQMLGEVDDDLVEYLGVDVLPVEPPALFFDINRAKYKPWTLFDGTKVQVPAQFEIEQAQNGDWLLHDGGDASKPVVARMPKDGYYFDRISDQSLHPTFEPPPLGEMEREYSYLLPNETLDHLAQKAEGLRKTEKALILGCWLDFAPPSVGSIPDWLCLMATDPDYVEKLFAIKTNADLNRLENLAKYMGDKIDLFGVDGVDYGTQRAELFSPELFARFHKPYYTAINGWIHENTPWKTWKHTCGSIPHLLPHFIESGLDAINPVQTSAQGMDAHSLKTRYGHQITFWGGGVDTQRVLPFSTPEEVYRHVADRIAILSPGGGFVFAAVHNIQAKTPPENIQAVFQAVQDSAGC